MRSATSPKTTVFSRLITAGIAVVFLLLTGVLAVGAPAPHTPLRTELKADASTPAAFPLTVLETTDDFSGEEDDVASAPLLPSFACLPTLFALFPPVGADKSVGVGYFLVTRPLRLHLLFRVLLI